MLNEHNAAVGMAQKRKAAEKIKQPTTSISRMDNFILSPDPDTAQDQRQRGQDGNGNAAVFPVNNCINRPDGVHDLTTAKASETDTTSAARSKLHQGPLHSTLSPTHGIVPKERGLKMDTVYKKAPCAPKRFKSNYVCFFTDFVEKKKKLLADGLSTKLDIHHISKECSQAWKALPPDQRKYWDDKSEKEKEVYEKKKESYKGPWRVATHRVKKKKEGAPKRSPSAFFLFVNAKRPEIRAQHVGIANQDVVKKCAELWKAMSDVDKTPFREEEEKLRAQYHTEVDKWEKEQRDKAADGKQTTNNDEPASGHQFFMHPPGYIPSKASQAPIRSKKRKKDPNAPKRSPPAFFLYVNHCRPEMKLQHPELRHTELVKLLGQKWSEMSEEDKKPFRDHEEQLRQQYHIEIKNYKKMAVPETEYTGLESYHQKACDSAVTEPQLVHAPNNKSATI